ncbi:GIY-YIG nuclease family protein [Streptomyces lavendulae]|uniref:GIY-YIG nuclease family protein n=1 Tax=Streptomyces lavendulae TaxID=1914 RepID=UPI0036EDC2BE
MSVPIRIDRGFFADLKREPSPETAVYRIYDVADALLYVGITNDTETRWRDHLLSKPWWRSDAHRYEVAWYPTRGDALAEEQRAIQNEHPKHNWMHAVLPRIAITPRIPGTYSTGEIAKRFRISPDTLRVLVDTPGFPQRLALPPPHRKGKRYPADAVEAYFDRLRPAPE